MDFHDEPTAPSAAAEVPSTDDYAPSRGERFATSLGRGVATTDELRERLANDVRTPTPSSVVLQPAEEAAMGDLLVVHMNLTPVAFEQKSFDALLNNAGIPIEPAAASPEQNVGSNASSREPGGATDSFGSFENRRSSRLELGQDVDRAQEKVDLVLVQAPPAQIVTCLSEAEKDRTNYLDIEVDDERTAEKQSAAQQTAVAGTEFKGVPTFDWTRYNRGRTNVGDREQLGKQLRDYYEIARDAQIAFDTDVSDGAAAYGGGGGQYGFRMESRAQQQYAKGTGELRTQARAVRIPSQDGIVPSLSEGKPLDLIAGRNRELAANESLKRELDESGSTSTSSDKTVDQAEDDMLQVLFVLRCPTSAPSTDAGNQSSSSAPGSDR